MRNFKNLELRKRLTIGMIIICHQWEGKLITAFLFLSRLQSKHGTDWAAIGAVLGRSASSVKDKCRLMKDTCNSGRQICSNKMNDFL